MTGPPIQWVSGFLIPEVKLPELETDITPPAVTDFGMCGAIPPLAQMFTWCDA
jgi:hypothetical protein